VRVGKAAALTRIWCSCILIRISISETDFNYVDRLPSAVETSEESIGRECVVIEIINRRTCRLATAHMITISENLPNAKPCSVYGVGSPSSGFSGFPSWLELR
jgi:hypothetical protein